PWQVNRVNERWHRQEPKIVRANRRLHFGGCLCGGHEVGLIRGIDTIKIWKSYWRRSDQDCNGCGAKLPGQLDETGESVASDDRVVDHDKVFALDELRYHSVFQSQAALA